jgi:hypothetical protein
LRHSADILSGGARNDLRHSRFLDLACSLSLSRNPGAGHRVDELSA